jgi:hypothetical protein
MLTRIRAGLIMVEGLNGRLMLHVARQGHSFCDSWRSVGTDLMGKSEKQLCIPHFSKNFHYPLFSTPNDETVFENFVLARRWITCWQQAVVMIDREFNNHGRSLPMLISSCKGRLAIEIVDRSQQKVGSVRKLTITRQGAPAGRFLQSNCVSDKSPRGMPRRFMVDTKEEIEQRIDELAREYGRTPPEDPRRSEIFKELSGLAWRLDHLLI